LCFFWIRTSSDTYNELRAQTLFLGAWHFVAIWNRIMFRLLWWLDSWCLACCFDAVCFLILQTM
jgi:hypothetical protein